MLRQGPLPLRPHVLLASGRRRSLLAIVFCFVAACSSAVPAGGGPGGAAVADAITESGALPAALVGTAPAPTGSAVRYFAADPATTGYLALPQGAGPHPGVILIHEWDGLVDRVRQFADALAAEGYAVLAADLYSGRTGGNPQENRALMAEAQAETGTIIDNLDAAAAWLRARPEVGDRIATIGWCFGGGVALSYALGGENHAGTAIFYGRLVTDPDSLRAIDHPVYGTFAGLDDGIPPQEVARFVDALRQAGVPNDVHVYDDVEHGFWLYVDADPATRAVPALDAWQRLRRYLAQTLRGG